MAETKSQSKSHIYFQYTGTLFINKSSIRFSGFIIYIAQSILSGITKIYSDSIPLHWVIKHLHAPGANVGQNKSRLNAFLIPITQGDFFLTWRLFA